MVCSPLSGCVPRADATREIRERQKAGDIRIGVLFDSIKWYLQDYHSTQLESFLLITMRHLSYKQDRQFDDRGMIIAKVQALTVEDSRSESSSIGNVLSRWEPGGKKQSGNKHIVHITANRKVSTSRTSTPAYENVDLSIEALKLNTSELLLTRMKVSDCYLRYA